MKIQTQKNTSLISLRALIILTVLSAVIIYAAVRKNQRPEVAQVLSAEAIMGTVPVRHEYCALDRMPGPLKPDLLGIVNRTDQVCTPYMWYETLLSPPHFYGQPTYRNCSEVFSYEQRVVGYDVVYKIENTVGKVRISYNPGDAMPVDNSGRLIILPGLHPIK